MGRYSGAVIFILILICGTALTAQTAGDLANSLDNYFTFTAGGALGPSMVTTSGAPFGQEARQVRDEMIAIGSNSDITCTVAIGVTVRWVKGNVSTNWTADDVILLCTGVDGASGTSASGKVIGIGSSVYVVGGQGVGANAAGGAAWAENQASTIGGYAEGYGGDAASGTGNGGLGWARNLALGPAFGQGGDADAGNGGEAVGQGDLQSTAFAGHSNTGDGGTATTVSYNSVALSAGGHSGTGAGGDAYAMVIWTTTQAQAIGGNSAGTVGGYASASTAGHAIARGGHGTTNADGGDAFANSVQDNAEAYGGQSLNGDGGSAEALAWLEAYAEGGASTNIVLGTFGGNAIATTRVSGTGDAIAIGGDGNRGGNATAKTQGAGTAVAVGGTGVLDPGNTTSMGGDATAEHTTSSGSAVATSGDAHPNAGTGGTAEATNSFVNPAQSNTYNPSNPFLWKGGTVVSP